MKFHINFLKSAERKLDDKIKHLQNDYSHSPPNPKNFRRTISPPRDQIYLSRLLPFFALEQTDPQIQGELIETRGVLRRGRHVPGPGARLPRDIQTGPAAGEASPPRPPGDHVPLRQQREEQSPQEDRPRGNLET